MQRLQSEPSSAIDGKGQDCNTRRVAENRQPEERLFPTGQDRRGHTETHERQEICNAMGTAGSHGQRGDAAAGGSRCPALSDGVRQVDPSSKHGVEAHLDAEARQGGQDEGTILPRLLQCTRRRFGQGIRLQ